jgi:hypothetical protein
MLEVNSSSGNPTLSMYKTDGTTLGIFLNAGSNSYFNTGGNVGIGLTSPNQKMSIVGANTAPTLSGSQGTLSVLTGATDYGIVMGTKSSGNGWVQVKRVDGTATAYNLELQPLGGNVGIGTANPVLKFSVLSNINTNNTTTPLILLGSDRNDRYASFNVIRGSDSEKIGLGISTSNDNLPIERMRITSGGSVVVNNLGTGLVYSNAGALTSTNPSDERLKNDITDLQYGLNEILQLRPVSYNWKNDTINQGKQFGFIAQEVQEIMPELISEFTTTEDEEEVVRLGLDKEGIYATLVNAIKELKAEIELLKQK